MLATSTSPGCSRPKSAGSGEHPGGGGHLSRARADAAQDVRRSGSPDVAGSQRSSSPTSCRRAAPAAAWPAAARATPPARSATTSARGRVRATRSRVELRPTQPEHVVRRCDHARPPPAGRPSSRSIRRSCGQARPTSASASSRTGAVAWARRSSREQRAPRTGSSRARTRGRRLLAALRRGRLPLVGSVPPPPR